MSDDTKLLAAWTPESYAGDFPPYINLAMVRLAGDVILTVRMPTVGGGPPGNTSTVTFTRDMWKEFVMLMRDAEKVYEACDFLDATM